MAKQKKPKPELGTEQLSPELIAVMWGGIKRMQAILSALLIDYADTVGKMEGKEVEEIQRRVMEKAKEIEEGRR